MNKLHISFLILILILIHFSCEKDDSSTVKTLSGTWDFLIIMQVKDSLKMTLTLVQNDNDTLSGNIYHNNKERILLPTSKINDESVEIDCLWDDPSILTFTGKINSRFDYMNGTYTSNLDYIPDTWSANKK